MTSKIEIKKEIARIQRDYKSVLTGSMATVQVNLPRALMQLSIESRLHTLHWVLGTEYKSKLKGTNR